MHDTISPDLRGLEADAYGQHGYFRATQARERGISSQLLSHYVRGGRFDRVRYGLYRLRGFPSSEHDEMREKWMAVGPEKAVLSHQSALALLDLSDAIPDAVHLLVGRRYRGLRRPPGTIIHTHPDDQRVGAVWRDGLPLTAPDRTLVDLVEDLQPEQAEMAVRQALERGLVTVGELRRAADGRPSRARAIEALLSNIGAR